MDHLGGDAGAELPRSAKRGRRGPGRIPESYWARLPGPEKGDVPCKWE